MTTKVLTKGTLKKCEAFAASKLVSKKSYEPVYPAVDLPPNLQQLPGEVPGVVEVEGNIGLEPKIPFDSSSLLDYRIKSGHVNFASCYKELTQHDTRSDPGVSLLLCI